MNCYLGVDMGTSSMKASLIGENGAILWQDSRPAGILNPREGFFEVDSTRVWWENFLSLCAGVNAAGFAGDVAGVCVSSVCATFVPVDENFSPLCNAVLYGIDRRAAAIADELNERYGRDFLVERLGGLFSTQSVLPKLIWFSRERPDIYEKAAAFIPSFDAVSSRLTGRCAWDEPTAFGALMLEMATLDYPAWLLDHYSIGREKLPPVKNGLSVLGPLTGDGAAATGFREGIPVMTGTGDVNAEAMSAGAIDAGTAVFVLGSTTSMMVYGAEPMRLPGYMPGVSLRANTWRLGAASSCGGLFLNWAAERFGGAHVPEKPTGIFFLPYLDGARSPFNNPGARGGIFGLKSSHGAADIAAAACETIGYDVALLIDRAEAACPFPGELHLTGGLCRRRDLVRLIADITGRTMLVHSRCDASFGSALIALGTAGGVAPEVKPDEKISPDPDRAAIYRPLRERYFALCDCLAAAK